MTRDPDMPDSCEFCGEPVRAPDGADHAACDHGFMTGCAECGIAYEGGYSLASDRESGPPCQQFINELEIGILAGNPAYIEEYEACRARPDFAAVRTFRA